jgi:hypothetical protein
MLTTTPSGPSGSSVPYGGATLDALATAVLAGDRRAALTAWDSRAVDKNLVGPSGSVAQKLVTNMVKGKFYIRLLQQIRVGRGYVGRGVLVGPDRPPDETWRGRVFVALIPREGSSGDGGTGAGFAILGLGRRPDQVSALVQRWSDGQPLDAPPFTAPTLRPRTRDVARDAAAVDDD